MDHGAKRTWGQSIGAALRLDRPTPGGAAAVEQPSAAPVLDAFERSNPRVATLIPRTSSSSTASTSTSTAASAAPAATASAAAAPALAPAAAAAPAATAAGRVRGWIHGGLNRGDLGERLAALSARRELLLPGHRSYYEAGAQLADEESASRLVGAVQVGPHGYCSPRHPTHFEPSCLKLSSNL